MRRRRPDSKESVPSLPVSVCVEIAQEQLRVCAIDIERCPLQLMLYSLCRAKTLFSNCMKEQAVCIAEYRNVVYL